MCHGSFATATCIRCKYRVQADDIKEKVLLGEVPYCPSCSTPEETDQLKYPLESQAPSPPQLGPQRRISFDEDNDDDEDELYPSHAESFPIPPVLKPDIVFFGEDLPDEFHSNLELDKHDCDLLLVVGSSLRVRPVSLIPGMLPAGVPQILINRESLGHCRFDIELLGNCDTIISQLCRNLGPDFLDLTAKSDLAEVDKVSRGEISGPAPDDLELRAPLSENDIPALKGCWRPKANENVADRLPENSYLNWRPRQYVFEGAEVLFDPDEDDDDDDSSDSDSDSSVSSNEPREIGTDELQNSNKPRIIIAQDNKFTLPVEEEDNQKDKV
jgi:NAD-dependent SIR2 family protein deacetylase